MALVFQYGSNASSERINSCNRLRGDACIVGIAYTAEDHELEFTVWSRNNRCAAANILSGFGRKIWGVIYKVPDYLIRRETAGNRKSLDAIEGEGQNYKRSHIAVRPPDGPSFDQEVITYIANKRRAGIKTSLEYAFSIVSGLREHKVPNESVN